jgi:hypothetical protein
MVKIVNCDDANPTLNFSYTTFTNGDGRKVLAGQPIILHSVEWRNIFNFLIHRQNSAHRVTGKSNYNSTYDPAYVFIGECTGDPKIYTGSDKNFGKRSLSLLAPSGFEAFAGATKASEFATTLIDETWGITSDFLTNSGNSSGQKINVLQSKRLKRVDVINKAVNYVSGGRYRKFLMISGEAQSNCLNNESYSLLVNSKSQFEFEDVAGWITARDGFSP